MSQLQAKRTTSLNTVIRRGLTIHALAALLLTVLTQFAFAVESVTSAISPRLNADTAKDRELKFDYPSTPLVTVELPHIETESRQEAPRAGEPLKIGIHRNLSQEFSGDLSQQLIWLSGDGDTMVGALSVSSPGAKAVRIAIRVKNLGAGELRFFGEQTDQRFAPITGADVADRDGKTIWSPVLDGDMAGVEVVLPSHEALRNFSLVVENLSHIHASVKNSVIPSYDFGHAICRNHIDVQCRDGVIHSGWEDAVAYVLVEYGGYSAMCTGTLLNDTQDGSFIPYLLTAAHCVSRQDRAETVTAWWFHQRATCGDSEVDERRVQSVGADLLAVSEDQDATLLRLKGQLPDGLTFVGWSTARVDQPTDVYGIHHAGGDIKKYAAGATRDVAHHLPNWIQGKNRIDARWQEGTTEQGSSGSGLFRRDDGSLIGVLSYGDTDRCHAASEVYGSFAEFYPSVRRWLAPGTGTNEPPTFAEGESTSRFVEEDQATGRAVGDPVTATDPDGDALLYKLGGPDAASFAVGVGGQLRTRTVLDRETKAAYAVKVTAEDGRESASIDVAITVTEVNLPPTFAEGASTTRSVIENTASGTAIGAPVAATDPDGHALTYTLGGTDAASFAVAAGGQLQTSAPLDRETKASYSVTVTADDGIGGRASINVGITVNDMAVGAPSNLTATTKQGIGIELSWKAPTETGDGYMVQRGGAKGRFKTIKQTHGAGTTYVDENVRDNVTYRYRVRTWWNVSFNTRTWTSKNSNVVKATVGGNNAPSFAEGASTTRRIDENTPSGTAIGTPVSATDRDGDVLSYRLGGTDATSFALTTSGQLQTSAALDYETKTSYSVTITADDGNGGSASIDVAIGVNDVVENRPPTFLEGASTTRSVNENTIAGASIGLPVVATDPDGDALSYRLGGTDVASFALSASGQLQTSAALDYETKAAYAVTITADDGNGGSASIDVAIAVNDAAENRPPTFSEGASTTRSVNENAIAGTSIGLPVTATDPDGDALSYRLGGADATSFALSASGQLQTKVALDYETKASYSVTITAGDGNGGSASIDVAIAVNDVAENRPPVFAEGASTTRSVNENAIAGTSIGLPVVATDPDGDAVSYRLEGTDATNFALSASGQLQVSAALDYESKAAYLVTITANDSNGGLATIDVAIAVNDVVENRPPIFSAGASATRSVKENTTAGTAIGAAVTATDPDGDTLSYRLDGADATSFTLSDGGQLQTKAVLDYEVKAAYAVTITADDSHGGIAAIHVIVAIVNVNERPGAPTSLTAVAKPGVGIELSWTAPDETGDGIDGYRVQRRAANGRFRNIVDTQGTGTAYVDANVRTGVTYHYRVRSQSANRTSKASNVADATASGGS